MVCCVACPGLVAAQPSPTPSLDRAARLFSQGEFEEALEVLDALAKEPLGDPTLAQIHVLRAQVLAGLKRPRDSAAALIDALNHDPELTLDPATVRPSLVAQLATLRRDLRGELVVRSPEGSTLFLNGAPLAGTSSRQQVPIGRHDVTVTFPGGRTAARQIVVRPQRTHEVVFVADPSAEPPHVAEGAPTATNSPPTLVGEPTAPSRTGHQLLLEARASMDLPRGAALEVGAGWSHAPVFASLSALLGGRVGMTARVGFEGRRLLGPVGAYVSADGVLFFGSPALLGGGAAAGANLAVTDTFEAFTEAAFRHVGAQQGVRSNYVLWGIGLRARL